MFHSDSERLHELLKNPDLRHIIDAIDTNPDPGNAIGDAMRDPVFNAFANECLQIVDPESYTED